MSERDHEHWREELSAYLLGALEPGEAAELERHLAGCEDCRVELVWLRPAARLLPESVERREAPRQLRTRIMAEVRAEAEGTQSGRSGRRSFGEFWRWIADRSSVSLRPAIGFAAIVLISAGIAAYAIRDGDAGSAATVVVAGKAPGVTAKMVREGDSGTLRLANVSGLRADEVLQAWVRRGERIESAEASLFVPNRNGAAIAVIEDMQGINAVMVTAEPRGGSDFPTSDPLISVPVRQ
jgi:anti-sigma-K factor RskA